MIVERVKPRLGFLNIHPKGQAETEMILHDHFVALIGLRRRALDDLRASRLQLRVQRINVVHPYVRVNAPLAARNVGRGSYATVRTHIRSLDAKLGVHSKVQAIVKARELALID